MTVQTRLAHRRTALIFSFLLFTLLHVLAGRPVMADTGTTAGQNENLPAESDFTEFAAEIESLRQALHIPGLSAAVVEDQELVWAQGFGYADVEAGIPATADTPYHLASVTKPIAATLLMQLVEDGRLDLDEKVADYGVHLPEADVTVWQLLTHTSEGQPGANHNYNGHRYGMLAQVIAGAAGESYGRLLNEEFLVPLGMSHTAANPSWNYAGWEGYLASLGLTDRYGNYPDVYQELARPYQFDANYDNVTGSYSLIFSPAAGLLASVTDIARFDIALDNDELVRPETREQMFAPAVPIEGRELYYGLGWYRQEFQDTRLVWHSGGWSPSVSALYVKAPDDDLTFIILANNYNLTRPYPYGGGDVLYGTPALLFYKTFVYPRHHAQALPAIDWEASRESIVDQLAGVTDRDARDVLEYELWSYRKLYASVGRFDLVNELMTIHRSAFRERASSRSDGLAVVINNQTPEPWPVSLRPDQVLLVGRLALGWLGLTAISLLLLALALFRRTAQPVAWPFKLAWLAITFVFGVFGLSAYLLSDGRSATGRTGEMAAWRRALGPALFSVTGGIVTLIAVLSIFVIFFPTFDGAAGVIAVAMFLSGWLLFRSPLAAWSGRQSYRQALRRNLAVELASTFLVVLGTIPSLVFTEERVLRDISTSDPLYGLGLVAAAVAATILVYPLNIWLVRRKRCDWPQLGSQTEPQADVAWTAGYQTKAA